MSEHANSIHLLQSPLVLPCGAVLKNRIAKSPMSDSLADGQGNPTEAQIRLYQRWAEGGVALSFIGEVQVDSRFPEKPGNLVFDGHSNHQMIRSLINRAMIDGAHLWPQLGHAGALSHPPISQPQGPSALDIDGLQCHAMSIDEIQSLPHMYAKAALYAKNIGFSGAQIHAGHGFLLSQFLSPLFNHRNDNYGGSIEARSRIVLEIIAEVRRSVGSAFPIGIRINSTDKLEGGLTELDALEVIRLLDQSTIDLIDISGGTYFPGAKASSDTTSSAPYFVDFVQSAKQITKVPLIATGGFKKRQQALDAIANGSVDMVGLARAMALNPQLANTWLTEQGGNPEFPRFSTRHSGGITAWYTMRLTALAENKEGDFKFDLPHALNSYEERDKQRCDKWRERFPFVSVTT